VDRFVRESPVMGEAVVWSCGEASPGGRGDAAGNMALMKLGEFMEPGRPPSGKKMGAGVAAPMVRVQL